MYDNDHAPRFLSGAATVVLVLAAVAVFLAFCLYAWNLLIAEEHDVNVPGVVASVETRTEPVVLWLGNREVAHVYLALDDGHALEISSDADGYEAVAGCDVGDKVEVGKREKLSAAGFLCEPGEILDTKYGDVRLVRQ